MRTSALIPSVMAMLLIAPAGAQDQANPPPSQQRPESATKVKGLQAERLAILNSLTEQLGKLYESGQVEVDEVIEARVQLFQAGLDAAETQSDRLTLYKNIVKELKRYEEIAQARMEAGQGLATAVLKIQARRLKVEIQLAQAQAE